VLSPAQWSLSKDQLEPLAVGSPSERYRALQRLRAEAGIPRWVGLADGDNVLPVDLDNALHVASFVQVTKGREGVSLVELLGEADLVAEGPEGRFAHEVIVPFVSKREPAKAIPVASAPAPNASVQRTFAPGSEWLYAKLFTGTAGVDLALKRIVAPVIERARRAGLARGWFFIRYGDPHWHLRLRIRGEAGVDAPAALLPVLHEAAAPFLGSRSAWKLQLDTYEREVGRYGGPVAIELVESVFEADSDAVLGIVELLEADEATDVRWRLALRGMHLLLVDLGFDLAGRTEILRDLRASFGEEHRVDVAFEKQLGQKFRQERPALEVLLTAPVGGDHPLDPGFELLAQRSERNAPLARELRAREREGALVTPLAEVAGSLLHMHANRLLRSEQRAQELVLYDFLLRLYESEAARKRRAG
jgi:thiopeptide-type bacteriocin biosynthesis protein